MQSLRQFPMKTTELAGKRVIRFPAKVQNGEIAARDGVFHHPALSRSSAAACRTACQYPLTPSLPFISRGAVLNSSTRPTRQAPEETPQPRIRRNASSSYSPGKIVTPSHASCSGSSPSKPHAALTSSRTGMDISSSLTVSPKPPQSLKEWPSNRHGSRHAGNARESRPESTQPRTHEGEPNHCTKLHQRTIPPSGS